MGEGEARYQDYKYNALAGSHLFSCLAILACTIIFATIWWNDQYLEGTIFPQVYSLRMGLYSLSVIFEAVACALFRFVKRSKRYAAWYHFFFGIWMIFVLSFDPHRIVVLWDDSTTYAEELAKWWLAYEPDYDTSNCGGLVVTPSDVDGAPASIPEQSCYFNSYESVYMIMIMGVMTVQGFYFRMPPSGYLLEVHVVVLLRAIILTKFGSVNTRASADFMDTAGLYVVLMLFFFAVRVNDAQLRNSFFLLQKTTRENEQSTERVEQLEEARGFDRELMMAMTFHEVRNPLNGTVGHLRLAKQLVAEMRRDAALPTEMRRDIIGGGGGGGGGEGGSREGSFNGENGGGDGGQYCTAGSGGSGSTLGALEEEVDESIVATELAVQYLGTLATLHGALTGSRELVLAPTELTELVRSAASVVRPQLQPGVELRVEVPDAKTHVMTDGLMLMQVLLNLMQNAARFTKQGFVCVRCTAEQAPDGSLAANFAVLDSGSGISEATKATLFDLYNSVGGIGLGMFLSGKLLSLLGSKIEVESPWRSDGPGAAFYFNIDMAVAALPSPLAAALPSPLPVAALPSSSTSSAAARAAAEPGGRAVGGLAAAAAERVDMDIHAPLAQHGGLSAAAATAAAAAAVAAAADAAVLPFEPNLRVLVADDGMTNRRLLRRAFTGFFGQDWLVTEATTAEEALSLVLEAPADAQFALIVMDEIFAQGLEAMRGSAAIAQIRAFEARTGAARRAVIVSCTGNALSSLAVDLKTSGADLVWGKPMPNFTNREMQDEVAPYLAASASAARP